MDFKKYNVLFNLISNIEFNFGKYGQNSTTRIKSKRHEINVWWTHVANAVC